MASLVCPSSRFVLSITPNAGLFAPPISPALVRTRWFHRITFILRIDAVFAARLRAHGVTPKNVDVAQLRQRFFT